MKRTWSQRVPFRLDGSRLAQNSINRSSSHSFRASVLILKFLSAWRMGFQGAAAESVDGRQNVVGRLGPAQRPWVGVGLLDELLDGRDQLFDRLVGAALDLLLGKQREEALDLIDP